MENKKIIIDRGDLIGRVTPFCADMDRVKSDYDIHSSVSELNKAFNKEIYIGKKIVNLVLANEGVSPVITSDIGIDLEGHNLDTLSKKFDWSSKGLGLKEYVKLSDDLKNIGEGLKKRTNELDFQKYIFSLEEKEGITKELRGKLLSATIVAHPEQISMIRHKDYLETYFASKIIGLDNNIIFPYTTCGRCSENDPDLINHLFGSGSTRVIGYCSDSASERYSVISSRINRSGSLDYIIRERGK